jgi:hypothetical protein
VHTHGLIAGKKFEKVVLMKSLESLTKNMDSDMTCTRPFLLMELRRIIDYADNRVFTKQTKAHVKPQWARILTQAVSVAASILKDDDLEAIQEQIRKIEAKLP